MVYKVGINDADYCVQPYINGRQVACPFYKRWKSMLARCYDPAFHKIEPSYIGCKVIKEWYRFTNFKKWMEEQTWENRELDKDLLVPGNKIYCPDRCLFIPQDINRVFNDYARGVGDWPLGVVYHKRDKIFEAKIRKYGKRVYLGRFSTPEQAHQAYLQAKKEYIWELAQLYKQSEPKLYNALIQYT